MMNTPIPMNSTLNHSEKSSTASRPSYRVSSTPHNMITDTAITANSPAMDSHPSRFFRFSGSTKSAANTKKAKPAKANSGVSRSRFEVSDTSA